MYKAVYMVLVIHCIYSLYKQNCCLSKIFGCQLRDYPINQHFWCGEGCIVMVEMPEITRLWQDHNLTK